jgi:hypothetical protein
MRLTFFACALFFGSQLCAYPIIVQLKSSLEADATLMNPKTGKFMPLLANSRLEFAVFDPSDWIIIHGNLTTPLHVVLEAHRTRLNTVPIYSLNLERVNDRLRTVMDEYGMIDTDIPSVFFRHIVHFLAQGWPTLFFARDELVIPAKRPEQWLRLSLPYLVPLFENALKETATRNVNSWLIASLRNYLVNRIAPGAQLPMLYGMPVLVYPSQNLGAAFL